MPDNRIDLRGNTANLTISCLNNETHNFSVRWGNALTSPYHNHEADLVILGLGGTPHPCNLVEAAYSIAQISYFAYAGISDVPNLKYVRNKGYRATGRCPGCQNRWNTLTHLSSVEHLCETSGIPQMKQIAKSLKAWIQNNAGNPTIYDSEEKIVRAYPAFRSRNNNISYTRADTTSFTLDSLMLTPTYINNAIKIVGNNIARIVDLRASGITLNWLKESISGFDRPKLVSIKNGTSNEALIGARNLPAAKVKEYFTAGVYTNLYTYEKAGASPTQAARISTATKGRISLANILADGHTLFEAEQLANFHENFNRNL